MIDILWFCDASVFLYFVVESFIENFCIFWAQWKELHNPKYRNQLKAICIPVFAADWIFEFDHKSCVDHILTDSIKIQCTVHYVIEPVMSAWLLFLWKCPVGIHIIITYKCKIIVWISLKIFRFWDANFHKWRFSNGIHVTTRERTHVAMFITLAEKFSLFSLS